MHQILTTFCPIVIIPNNLLSVFGTKKEMDVLLCVVCFGHCCVFQCVASVKRFVLFQSNGASCIFKGCYLVLESLEDYKCNNKQLNITKWCNSSSLKQVLHLHHQVLIIQLQFLLTCGISSKEAHGIKSFNIQFGPHFYVEIILICISILQCDLTHNEGNS